MVSTIDGDQLKNVSCVVLAVTACLCYCHLISSRLPKGKWRLISLVPVFYIFTIIPLYTTSVHFTSVAALLFTWLDNFKLLLFAFNHGPLALQPQKYSLLVFITIASFPFKIKPIDAPQKPKRVLPLYLATEIPIFVVLVPTLHFYKEYLLNHPHIELFLYCIASFFLVEIVLELPSLLVQSLLGLELESASDEPYLSTSLQEFWGRRWNLTVISILRETIYKPIRFRAAEVMGRDWAALLGVLTTFLVSGLMHELWIWYITRASPTWEMTMFFVVQGVAVVVESGLKVALAAMKWQVPWFVSGPLTLGFVVGTSYWLFWPPLMRNGVAARIVEEFLLYFD